ncbi:MAG: hypothetical protein EBS05_12670, partial [Proteobacteria bacterium]|nr:hypothetical protein [Pseudomonadota bacterium]
MPWAMDQDIPFPRVRLGMKVSGWMVLAFVPLLSWDYYRHAASYSGYFHPGLGGYLIVLAYLLIGTSL